MRPTRLPLALIGLSALAWPAASRAASFAYVTNSQFNVVSVINTATQAVVATINVGTGPRGVAVNPAGTRVYVVNQEFAPPIFNPSLSVIDTLSNTVVATVDISTAEPRGIAVNPAGTKAYVSHGCCSVLVLDTSSNTVTATVPIAAAPTEVLFGVAVNPAGTRAYVSQLMTATLSVVDTASNTEIATVPSAGSLGLVVSPDGLKVYAANTVTGTGQNIKVIDTTSNSVTTTIPLGCTPWAVALNPAGTRLYVACAGASTLKAIDTGTNSVIGTVILPSVTFGVSVTPDGSLVYASANDDVAVVDATTNTLSSTIPIGGDTHAFGQFIGPDFVCGNGVPEPGEECDDGNAIETDGCLSSCVTAPLPVPLLSPAGLVAYALALLAATALVLRRRAAAPVSRAGGAA